LGFSPALLTDLQQILQGVALQAKRLGKAVYVFSADTGAGKVAHVNHVPEAYRTASFDARTWASTVSDVLGGKVILHYPAASQPSHRIPQAGGKEDGAQGVGTNVDKVYDAAAAAKQAFHGRK
jgi:alanyl-tRNA synthetase